jgi:hypothetical protein
MNYGWDNTDPLWKEDRKQRLAERLREAFPDLSVSVDDSAGVRGLYPGVRLRSVFRDWPAIPGDYDVSDDYTILLADKIFVEVMS